MTLKSDLEQQGQTILNSHFLTVMLMTGTLYLILLCQLPVRMCLKIDYLIIFVHSCIVLSIIISYILSLESSFYMGIQFPPIAFLYLLYLFIVFFFFYYLLVFLSCTVVKSIIKLKLKRSTIINEILYLLRLCFQNCID